MCTVTTLTIYPPLPTPGSTPPLKCSSAGLRCFESNVLRQGVRSMPGTLGWAHAWSRSNTCQTCLPCIGSVSLFHKHSGTAEICTACIAVVVLGCRKLLSFHLTALAYSRPWHRSNIRRNASRWFYFSTPRILSTYWARPGFRNNCRHH